MYSNVIFDTLWDGNKTHAQLVQRSGKMFRSIIRAEMLTLDLLKRFWMLAKSYYKGEVLKILEDSAYFLETEHIEFLFDEITTQPASKLGIGDLEALTELRRF